MIFNCACNNSETNSFTGKCSNCGMTKSSQGTITSNNTTMVERYKTIHENSVTINPALKSECFAKPPVEKFYSNYIFELDKVEEENLKKYFKKLKDKYGSYGFITYSFTPTGIGTVIKVKSSHENKAKDITNLSSW